MSGAPLTIAVPKGALFTQAAERLRAAGIDVPLDPGRKLTVHTPDDVQLLLLRPTDVPAYVEFGAADCGIVGKDVLWETERHVVELLKHDGERVVHEVYLFAQRDPDGRFNRIEETTLKLGL